MYVMRPTSPSSPTSTPSYRRCASDIVRLGEKRSLLDASCCSFDVMKGGGAYFLRSLRSTLSTRSSAPWIASTAARASPSLDISAFLPSMRTTLARKGKGGGFLLSTTASTDQY